MISDIRYSIRGNSAEGVRNYICELDLLKFVAALGIALFHSYTLFGRRVCFSWGYLTCELFFVITGFLFAASLERNRQCFSLDTIWGETGGFLLRKLRMFLIPYAMCFGVVLLLRVFHRPTEAMSIVWGAVPDFLLLRCLGIPLPVNVLPANWYVSAMMVSLAVLYPLARFRPLLFKHYLAPFLALAGFSYLFANFNSVSAGMDRPVHLSIRAMSGICLGVVAFVASQRIRDSRHSRLCWWGGVSLSAFSFVFMSNMKSSQEIPMLLITFFLGVSFLTGGTAPVSCRSAGWECACRHLGKLSMTIYFMHCAVRFSLRDASRMHGQFGQALSRLFHSSAFSDRVLTLALYAVLTLVVSELVVMVSNRRKDRLK